MEIYVSDLKNLAMFIEGLNNLSSKTGVDIISTGILIEGEEVGLVEMNSGGDTYIFTTTS